MPIYANGIEAMATRTCHFDVVTALGSMSYNTVLISVTFSSRGSIGEDNTKPPLQGGGLLLLCNGAGYFASHDVGH